MKMFRIDNTEGFKQDELDKMNEEFNGELRKFYGEEFETGDHLIDDDMEKILAEKVFNNHC